MTAKHLIDAAIPVDEGFGLRHAMAGAALALGAVSQAPAAEPTDPAPAASVQRSSRVRHHFPYEFCTWVHGASMGWDGLKGGWVYVKRVPYEELKAGDTVIFYNIFTDKLVHHRLAYKQKPIFGKGGGWIARGDANLQTDMTLITPKNYIGRTGRISKPHPWLPNLAKDTGGMSHEEVLAHWYYKDVEREKARREAKAKAKAKEAERRAKDQPQTTSVP